MMQIVTLSRLDFDLECAFGPLDLDSVIFGSKDLDPVYNFDFQKSQELNPD